ncbi:MAG: hypothetical protein V3V00_06105 [Saprospiraceae bacterium]
MIKETVIATIQDVVDSFSDAENVKIDENSELFGKNSIIDSMTLVSIIVDIEELFSDKYNKEICLTDDRAMTREQSPFDSVKTLIDYIEEITKK